MRALKASPLLLSYDTSLVFFVHNPFYYLRHEHSLSI